MDAHGAALPAPRDTAPDAALGVAGLPISPARATPRGPAAIRQMAEVATRGIPSAVQAKKMGHTTTRTADNEYRTIMDAEVVKAVEIYGKRPRRPA